MSPTTNRRRDNTGPMERALAIGPDPKPLFQNEILLQGGDFGEVALVLQRQSNGLDFLIRATRQVGNGAMADLSIISVGLSQEVGSVFFPVDGFVNSVESHRVYFIRDSTRLNKA